MKIAHIVCTFPPYKGGIGNVTYQIVSRLDRIENNEVTVFTPLIVFYFIIGGRMDLARELTNMIASFGFFIILFVFGLFSNNKKNKRIKENGDIDEVAAYVNNRMKIIDLAIDAFLPLS